MNDKEYAEVLKIILIDKDNGYRGIPTFPLSVISLMVHLRHVLRGSNSLS
jgi:hypothetical protein